jgi:lysophospholipase L1-like esterase
MKLRILACLLLIIPVQAHSRNIISGDIVLSIDGDSMVDDVGGSGTLTANLKTLLGTNWKINDFSVGGSTVTGANSITARERDVDATYSRKNQRNELLIWIGTNDGCNEGDTAATTAGELETYLLKQLKVGWKITLIAVLPRDAPWCMQPSETFRSHFNAAMFAWTQAHGVRYLDPVQEDPALANPDDTTYYLDGTHPTALTENIIAQQVVNLIGKQQVANVTGN